MAKTFRLGQCSIQWLSS